MTQYAITFRNSVRDTLRREVVEAESISRARAMGEELTKLGECVIYVREVNNASR